MKLKSAFSLDQHYKMLLKSKK